MKKSKTYSIGLRRKRKGKTDYRKRISLLKSGKDRIVVRKSNKSIMAQIVGYNQKGDVVLVSAHSSEIKKNGLKTTGGNVPAAYLVGLLVGKKALQKGIVEAVADIGLNQSTKGSRIYAVIKGAIDAGLKVPISEDVLPKKEGIEGKNIEAYAKLLEEKKNIGMFSEYQKNNLKPADISKHIEEIKKKIMGGS